MRRVVLAVCLAAAAGLSGGGAAASASKATLCVRAGGQCFATIQAAVDAAHDGDTIQVGFGTFAGGITINKSISIVGSGAAVTVIRGGGPVLTIGALAAATEPTVSISGVRITGGSTTSTPDSDMFPGGTFRASGGGISVPPAADFAPGATVTVSNSLISGNRAAPTSTLGPTPDQVSGWPVCPTGPCPFAGAQGGGIDNWGAMTLTNTIVSDNQAAGSLTSDADGGGIWSAVGSLTLSNSVVTHNQATAVAPNGRFAEGGGLFVDSGALTVRNTIVSLNSASLTSTLPLLPGGGVIDMNANSGGIHVGDGVPTTVENAAITGNSVAVVDLVGEPVGFDAAMLVGDSPLTMRNTVISGNQATAAYVTSADVGPSGSALELDGGGTISNTRIVGNSASATSPAGAAAVSSGLAVFNFNNDAQLVTVQDSVISGNAATASSTTGSATVLGAGIFNNSLLDLRNVQVTGNSGKATGPSGVSQGGGIWNGDDLSGPAVLSLENSLVARNAVTGSSGITVQGGGLFTTLPVTLTHSQIVLNSPDQCFGC